MAKKINPAVIHSLNEALSLAFWYRSDLREFIRTTLPENNLIGQLNWDAPKRIIVGQLVRTMVANDKYQNDLLDLILATADVGEPSHLRRLEDGETKYANALNAINDLRKKIGSLQDLRDEEDRAKKRKLAEQERAASRATINDKLGALKEVFHKVISSQDSQARGYALEGFLRDLFTLFDISTKASFRVLGEQIDGGFTFEGTEYILEARWRKEKASVADLDNFSKKIARKAENTRGLFLSINGFENAALELHSQRGEAMIAMNGEDLALVLEGRVDLIELLIRKRQHAAWKGQIMLEAKNLL